MAQGIVASFSILSPFMPRPLSFGFDAFEVFVVVVSRVVVVSVPRVRRVVPDRPRVYLFPVTPSPLSAIRPPNRRRWSPLRHRRRVKLPLHPRRVRVPRIRPLRTRRP